LAVQPDSGYIVAFIDLNGLDGQAEGIFARMFNPDGFPKGPQFKVNTLSAGQQYSPSIGVAPDGSFIIAWEGPGSSIDVWAQSYTKDGVKVGSQFLLNTTVSGNQRYPEIQFFQDSTWMAGFVDGAQTILQKFDELGRQIGLETRIISGLGDVVTDGMCVRPDVSILLTWTTGQDIYGQIFTNSLEPVGTQTSVNTFTSDLCEYCLGCVDGAGYTHDWTYTYTIGYNGGLTPPPNGASMVACPGDAVNPGAPAPITDACGRTVSAVLVDATVPSCGGTVVWTYRYTACDGFITADWTYTYTIVNPGVLSIPANGSATVSCPSEAIDPGEPATV
jgi:hypothetical protein